MALKILQFPVGPLEMNATLVMDVDSKETIFFDPGDEIDRVIKLANCNTFIEELSNGILTKIGDENSSDNCLSMFLCVVSAV